MNNAVGQQNPGIDAVLDGHSHSTIAMELVKNKDGKEIPLSSSGT